MNILLIPRFGILGAACATTLALIIRNAFYSIKLHKDYRIHPFTKHYIKPALASVCIMTIIYILVRNVLSTVVLWHLPLFIVGFLCVYILSLLLTRSFDREDMLILVMIEEKTGVNLSAAKKLIGKFL